MYAANLLIGEGRDYIKRELMKPLNINARQDFPLMHREWTAMEIGNFLDIPIIILMQIVQQGALDNRI